VPKITPQESVQKWQQRTAAATNSYVDGINRVNSAPGESAARQADVYLANVQSAVNKWKRNVAAVSLNEWQNAAITLGAPRIASGVNAATEKTLRATERNFQNIDNALAGLPPRGTFEQNMARMNQFVTKLHQESQS
tara:strand:- start:938 stop:1348 length:411 start_codon:yes stop_codon:yes gene_type:complete